MSRRLVGWTLGAVVVAAAPWAWSLRDSRDDPTVRSPISDTATTVAATVWQTTNLPPPLTDAATTTKPAVRATVQIQVSEPVPPPFDPIAYVNGLAYCHACMPPAMEAYRIVALTRGWTEDQIVAASPFVEIIMATESGGCWNVRRWGYGEIGQDCRTLCMGGRKGECAYDDAGFGQITNILRTPAGPLCAIEGICTIAQTIASPWSSMTAYVRVLEDGGNRAWCYRVNGVPNSHIRNGHCGLWRQR